MNIIPFVSSVARELYSTELHAVLNIARLEQRFAINQVTYEATNIANYQKELRHLKGRQSRIELQMKGSQWIDDEESYRSLNALLQRTLEVSRFLFAEKLAVVAEGFVDVLTLILEGSGNSNSTNSRVVVEYALNTMHLMLRQVIDETIGHLTILRTLASPTTIQRLAHVSNGSSAAAAA